jgi:hypothetical protein
MLVINIYESKLSQSSPVTLILSLIKVTYQLIKKAI